MIKDYKVGDTINNLTVYCVKKVVGTSSKGDSYFSLTLQDASGQLDAKVWDITTVDAFEDKDFINVTGTVQSFKDAPQLKITSAYKTDPTTVKIEDFCPQAPRSVDEMWTEFMEIVNSVKNEHLSALLKAFFENEKIVKRFKENSAAKVVHHAYVGGLLDHSLSVAKICVTLANNYPALNRDLLITVAVLHDIGKIKEIAAFPENDYTDEGNLLGHIYMGAEMVDIQVRKIEGFPKTLANEVKHCILAHHGGLEYGSPKVPALIEATALSFADDTDAKLRRFSDLLTDAPDGWSERSDYFLGSKFRKTVV
jgi:3'-5' exoribonuclease